MCYLPIRDIEGWILDYPKIAKVPKETSRIGYPVSNRQTLSVRMSIYLIEIMVIFK
jgi:hypothetical protein